MLNKDQTSLAPFSERRFLAIAPDEIQRHGRALVGGEVRGASPVISCALIEDLT
jgi:hypothetical protein